MSETNEKIFAEYFSKKVLDGIAEWGKSEAIPVYRVGKYGKNDDTAFLNYYEEVERGLKVVRNREACMDSYTKSIDSLSVSCYENKEDIEEYYKVTLKDIYPQRILLFGETIPQDGPSIRTKERKEKCKDSHVDWWLYRDAEPWKVFKVEEA